MTRDQLFNGAVTNTDGTVNVGYLVLIRSGQAVIAVIATMVLGAIAEMAVNHPHVFNMQPLGIAIGSVLGGYATVLGAVGVFLWGDAKQGGGNGVSESR
jgi:hypothetical protein